MKKSFSEDFNILKLLPVQRVNIYFTYEQAFNSTNKFWKRWITTQPAFTCSKLTMETLEQCVNYVQS